MSFLPQKARPRSIETASSVQSQGRTPLVRSKGGLSTKILTLTDALGNLARFVLLPGHRYDSIGVLPLIEMLSLAG